MHVFIFYRLDDIQDNSILRRGIPVAHAIYGIPSTINAANYVIFIALEKTLSLCHPDATQIYTEQLLELHRGQGMEIYWRDNFQCPSEDDYKEMTVKSTYFSATLLTSFFFKYKLNSNLIFFSRNWWVVHASSKVDAII